MEVVLTRGRGSAIGSSAGWRWALPESRPSPGRCRKSPNIYPVAPQPEGPHRDGGEGRGQLGSALPASNAKPKCLQVMSDSLMLSNSNTEVELTHRC